MANEEFEGYKRFGAYSQFDPSYYDYFNVKRGLRNPDGSGVVAGLTSISNVHGYLVDEGAKVPVDGKLTLRGYDLYDFVDGTVSEGRFGYEELVHLLWLGDLPTAEQMARFQQFIDSYRDLPRGFVNNLIMNFPSASVMNAMARSVLMLYATDSYVMDKDDIDPRHEIDVATSLVSRLPRMAVLAYLANGQREGKPMYINPPRDGLSTAETVFYMLRQDREWTQEEAKMLDIMLMLHAEHGGGNNSTFTTRVLTSSGTDAYSAYAGGISSLKGPRHGGANIRAAHMQADLMEHVDNWADDGQVADYLVKILHKDAYDGTGLIYGMGHAVYTKSDPRAQLCKKYAKEMAAGTEYEAHFNLIERIERLTPEVFLKEKGSKKVICANIDMYSGLVYKMLGIPEDLYTPLFAVSRIAGWAAHRFEEIATGKRIIRPAYKAIYEARDYVPMGMRDGGVSGEMVQPISDDSHEVLND